jgi:SAGA-associated factor 29
VYVFYVSDLPTIYLCTCICIYIYIYTGISIRADAPPSELAVAVARHFENMEVDEEDCIGGFLQRLEVGSAMAQQNNHGIVPCTSFGNPQATITHYQRSNAYYDGHMPYPAVRKRSRHKNAARPGEQVAAKVTRSDENGSWILASVQRFYSDTETYDVQDEDDTSKLIRLPWHHVMRLSTGTEGTFVKGTACMAIFPETTSFYRAVVSKDPIWILDHNLSMKPGTGPIPSTKEIIVKFEDDEDSTTGKAPNRRVPSRFVIPSPANYFYDDVDDVDLIPP